MNNWKRNQFLSPAVWRKGDYVVVPSVRHPSVRPSVRPSRDLLKSTPPTGFNGFFLKLGRNDPYHLVSRISKYGFSQTIVNLRHRRSEVTVFTPFCLFVCLFVNSIPEKLLDQFRRNLVGGLGMVQGSCH